MFKSTPKSTSEFRSRLLMSAVAAASALAFAAPAQTPAPAAIQPAADAPSALPAGVPVIQLQPDQLALVLKALAEAESHGFRRGEFGAADIAERFASSDPEVRAQAAVQVGPAIVRYAQAQRGQRIAGKFLADWGVRPEPYDAPAAFAQAVAADKVGEWLASLPPPYEGYRQMRVALASYKEIAGRGGWSALPDGPSLKPGMRDPRVPALRQRLAWEDDQVPAVAAGADPALMDKGVSEALARFQARHGLTADGALGKGTLAELNISAAARLRTVEANLERWRWAPRTAPATRIEVNIASQQVELYQAGKLTETMRAVAGRKTDPTPMLTSQIHTVVLNPAWNVPTSIASKELWPKERANPGYLQRENFVIRDGGGLQQRPGPGNSLGRVKFDFDNRYGVYLHDTPGRAAFARDMRSLSHGCVRLERPVDLAKRLVGDGSGSEKIDEVLLSEDTTRVPLATPVPVYLFYWTVFVDGTAKLNFRNDIYDWDVALLRLLDAGKNRA
jgi:murein L,D-transpeptidase YcbB/YkuD